MRKRFFFLLSLIMIFTLLGCDGHNFNDPRSKTFYKNFLPLESNSDFPYQFEHIPWLAEKDEVLQIIKSRGISENDILEQALGQGSTLYISCTEKNPFDYLSAEELVTVYCFVKDEKSGEYELYGGNYVLIESSEETLAADRAELERQLLLLPGEMSLENGKTAAETLAEGYGCWNIADSDATEEVYGAEGVLTYKAQPMIGPEGTDKVKDPQMTIWVSLSMGRQYYKKMTGN